MVLQKTLGQILQQNHLIPLVLQELDHLSLRHYLRVLEILGRSLELALTTRRPLPHIPLTVIGQAKALTHLAPMHDT